ncbi:hypothetical protein QTG54_000704 [Skeletonema marinoi]|uniref:Calmodulin n=1 Tax=Skeletonema marinoi TaxID=267567 RepID=A0AAD8YNS7_9STRA|nr:hypothetical protein QTG54_000704 [Skeletonema marinoi]
MTKITNKCASILTIMIALSSCSLGQAFTHQTCSTKTTHLSMAGGWGNNQEREFMQRVNSERKTLRRKKAADLLEVARIAGVELKKKEKDPEKLDMFDAEDMSSGDDEYLDVSI